MFSMTVSMSSAMSLITIDALSTALSTAEWIGAASNFTLISGVPEVVDVVVTFTTGDTAFATFSAALLGAAAFLAGAFLAGAFFAAAFLTGADFGVDFFFCVAIADIIATTALP